MLQALGLPHELVALPDGAALVVPGWAAPRAHAELLRWQSENEPSPREPPVSRRSSGRDGAAAFALALVVASLAQSGSAFGGDWFEAGVLDAACVARGEWGRALTALLLHLDPAHLWANVGFGALFVGVLCWRLGTGAGLLSTLLAGTAGNLLSALLRPAGRAAGASTAVFAALGLLAVLGLRPRGPRAAGALRRWAPLLAALALFGYLGAEGERVDVLGHAAGFACGLALGAVLVASGAVRTGAALGRALDRRGGQWACGLLALGLVAVAWAAALA